MMVIAPRERMICAQPHCATLQVRADLIAREDVDSAPAVLPRFAVVWAYGPDRVPAGPADRQVISVVTVHSTGK